MSSNHHLTVTSLPTGDIDHLRYLSEAFESLCFNSVYSDISLKVDEEIFHAHKVILAARSDYFRALLFGGMIESTQTTVELVGASSKAFKILLKYIYTGQMSLSSFQVDEILEILGLAHQYGFEDLEKAICDYLRQSLKPQNVCSIYDASLLYELRTLSKVCKTFIDSSTEEVLDSEGFLNLSPAALKELILRDSFYASEVKIFHSVMSWAQANSFLNTPELTDVLLGIRFSLMTSSELFSVVRPTGCVTSETILDALEFQEYAKYSEIPYRGVLKPNVNLGDTALGAKVLQGEMRSSLLDGNAFHYDLDKGYTRHAITDTPDNPGILIKLGTQAIVNHIEMLLWDRDLRSYSYYIEVSVNQKNWERIIDHTDAYCRSWQNLHFVPRVVEYIRIVGTHNTVNKVFHIVSFSIDYQDKVRQDKIRLIDTGFVAPNYNVATTKDSACVVEGVSRSRNSLLDGNTRSYDWDSGYTCHQLGSGEILVQLPQPYMLESMRLLLWDCDDRCYSYYIAVSVNMNDWEVICDKTNEECRSWQLIVFRMRPVVFIKIVGTRNTANEVFHCVHFECPANVDSETIEKLRKENLEKIQNMPENKEDLPNSPAKNVLISEDDENNII